MDLKAGLLRILIFEDRAELGRRAAAMVAEKIRILHAEKDVVNMIFAAAASQTEFLQDLCKEQVDWNRVNAFHMDEYIGLPPAAPQLFGEWLRERIFGLLPFRNVFYINGQAEDTEMECKRYSDLLEAYPADIVCMGIGENTHLAFNDPHVADFNDSRKVKVVDLDLACKQQQVNEGCFDSLQAVPSFAFTLTIPALMKAGSVYCMVPGKSKANAVYYTLTEEVKEKYPSTIIKHHSDAWLFLEKESVAQVAGRDHHFRDSLHYES